MFLQEEKISITRVNKKLKNYINYINYVCVYVSFILRGYSIGLQYSIA